MPYLDVMGAHHRDCGVRLMSLFVTGSNGITGELDETLSVSEDRFSEHVIAKLRPGSAT